jgi:hypothetical protein
MWSESLEIFNPDQVIYERLEKEYNIVKEAMLICQKRKGWSDKKTKRMINKLYFK